MWQAFMGWIGVDQYDEGNPIGQDFLTATPKRYDGSRPEYCVSGGEPRCRRHAWCARSPMRTPLSPRGVEEALERVKMMPAASGAREPVCPLVSGPAARGWVRAISSHARLDARRHQLALRGSRSERKADS